MKDLLSREKNKEVHKLIKCLYGLGKQLRKGMKDLC